MEERAERYSYLPNEGRYGSIAASLHESCGRCLALYYAECAAAALLEQTDQKRQMKSYSRQHNDSAAATGITWSTGGVVPRLPITNIPTCTCTKGMGNIRVADDPEAECLRINAVRVVGDEVMWREFKQGLKEQGRITNFAVKEAFRDSVTRRSKGCCAGITSTCTTCSNVDDRGKVPPIAAVSTSRIDLGRRVSSVSSTLSTVSLDALTLQEEAIDLPGQHAILSSFTGSSIAESVRRIFSSSNETSSIESTSISDDGDTHSNRSCRRSSTISRQSSIDSIMTSETRSRVAIHTNRRGSRGLTSFLLHLDFDGMVEEMTDCCDSSSNSFEAGDSVAGNRRKPSKTSACQEYLSVDKTGPRLAAKPRNKVGESRRQLFHSVNEELLNSGSMDVGCPPLHRKIKRRVDQVRRSSFSAHRNLNSRAA